MLAKRLISVIIPTYNASVYVSQCLETVLAQSYINLEVIVVDDGSEDDTVQLVKRYPVKLIQQENLGAAAARNAGIHAATGEYIHFMDVDDLINLEFYERMLDAIVSVDADMACCGYVHERLPSFTSIVAEKFLYVSTDDKMRFTNVSIREMFGNTCTGFPSCVIENCFLMLTCVMRMIRYLPFRLCISQIKIISVPGAVYQYKERSNSLVTSLSREKRRIRDQSIKAANEFCKKFASDNHIKVLGAPRYITFQYALLGFLPLVKKRMYNSGRVRWYLLGLFIFQVKQRASSRKMIW